MAAKRYFENEGEAGNADMVVWLSGLEYYAEDGLTGRLITHGNVYATVYAAALAALPNGTGTILDDTGNTGPGVQLNRYNAGVIYEPRLLLQNPVKPPPKQVVSVFDGGAGVEWDFGVDDAVNFKAGTQSISVTDNNHTGTPITHAPAVDLNLEGKNLFLRVYVDDWDNFAAITVFFGDAAWNNYFSQDINFAAGEKHGHWAEQMFPLSSFTVGAGAPSWNVIDSVRLTLFSVAGTTCVCTFDELSFMDKLNPRGIIVFRFDDNTSNYVPYALPVLSRYGWKAALFWQSFYALPVNIEHLNLAHQAGWDICSHTHTHLDVGITTANVAMTDTLRSLRIMEKEGLLGSWRFFAHPGGSTSYEIEQHLKRYFHMGFITNDAPTCWLHGAYMRVWTVTCDDKAEATVAGIVDLAVANNDGYVLLFHHIGPSAGVWSQAAFITLCAYIATLDVDVYCPSELVDIIERGRRRRTNAGTAVILNTGTTVVVYHGLPGTPVKVVVTGSTADTSAPWVTAIGALTFTVNVAGAVGGNRPIYWRAEL